MNSDYSYGPSANSYRNRIIKLEEVKSITGLSRSSIYRKINENKFPKSVRLSGNSVGWVEQEVQQWVIDRIAERGI